MNTDHDKIIIIGAGASGLLAGAILSPHHNITVLEARHRTGGRIFSIPDKFQSTAEAGAEFVHGEQPLTQELLDKSASTTHRFDGPTYRNDGGKIRHEENMFGEHWDELVKSLQELNEDLPIGQFLNARFPQDKYRELRKAVRQFAEGYDAADLDRVSSFALREEWSQQDDDEQMRVGGGYRQLISYLQRQVEEKQGRVVLNAEVSKIIWSPGAAQVFTVDGRMFEGNRVLITIPLGVLQQNTISFSPRLPKHEVAFSRLGFGGVIKFLFELATGVWDHTIQKLYPGFGFIFSDADIPTWWSQAPAKNPMITGWLSGPAAFRISKGESFLYEAAVKSLCYLLNVTRDQLISAIITWKITDWISDPFSRGAYAYATVGSQQQIDFLLTPVEDTIYFAGEALYAGSAMGTVEAALHSGRDAARKILEHSAK